MNEQTDRSPASASLAWWKHSKISSCHQQVALSIIIIRVIPVEYAHVQNVYFVKLLT